MVIKIDRALSDILASMLEEREVMNGGAKQTNLAEGNTAEDDAATVDRGSRWQRTLRRLIAPSIVTVD